MSVEQLTLKLEKSEAGRKKLRQAISILQEKLDATEKVLQINETLRQECEQERQHAEDEKKKAEEEKKLRCMLEKDSVVVKDQLAKVLQRLGAVEAKQKLDQKEADRLRAEVKIAVEGVHVASKTVNAMKSALESFESSLLEKVNAAFEKSFSAPQAAIMEKVQSSLENAETTMVEKVNAAMEKSIAASEMASAVQLSLENLENSVVQKGGCAHGHSLRKLKHVTEDIVDNIAQLFVKEKKSHLKIEHGLATLKDLLKEGKSDKLISTSSADLSSDEWARKNRKRYGKSQSETLAQYVHVPGIKARKRKRYPLASDAEALRKKRKWGKTCSKAEIITKGSGSASEEQGLERSINLLESTEAAYASSVCTDDLEQDMDVDLIEGELENEKWFKGKALLSPNLPYVSSPIHPSSPPLTADIVLLPVEISEAQHKIVLEGGTEDAAAGSLNVYGAGFCEGEVMDVGNGMHMTSFTSWGKSEGNHRIQDERSMQTQSYANILQSQVAPIGHSSEVDSLHSEEQQEESYADYEHVIKLDRNGTAERRDCLVSTGREVLAAGVASIGTARFQGSECGVCDYMDIEERGDPQNCEKFELETFDNPDIGEINEFLEALPVITSAREDAPNMPCGEQYLASGKLDYPESCEPSLLDKSIETERAPTNRFPSNLLSHASSRSLKNECHSQLQNEGHSSVAKNIQLVNRSVHLKKNSSAVFFLQGLDFNEEDKKKNAIVVGMIAFAVRNYLLAEGVGKNNYHGLKSLIATDLIVQIPFWSLECSFISSLVDVARSDIEGEHSKSNVMMLNSLVETFVRLIRTVFDEKSSSVLDSIFAQLRRFLIEGNTTLMTLHGIEQEALVSAEVLLEGQVSMAYCRFKATLKDICAGSKFSIPSLPYVGTCRSLLGKMTFWDMQYVQSSESLWRMLMNRVM